MNQTHNSLTSTKTTRTPGLVGDLCVKVIGDCSKFMECRMNENYLAWNISTCQCLDGYQSDRFRNCRKSCFCFNLKDKIIYFSISKRRSFEFSMPNKH